MVYLRQRSLPGPRADQVKRSDSLVIVVLLALLAWMLKCLMETQETTATAVEKATKQNESSLKMISTSFTTSMTETVGKMVDLTEVLMLGRDSPLPNENSPTNSNDSEVSNEPEIDMRDLPESAAWALEEEQGLTQMPWQSSTQQPDSEILL